MKKIIFLLFFASSISFGQNNNGIWSWQPNFFFFSCNDCSETIIAYKMIGTPYQFDEYANGSANIFNKKGFDAPMRYNASKDVIEFLDDDEKVKEILRRPYITATFKGNTYQVLPYIEDEDEKLGYFNALNSGQTQLLFMPKKMIRTASQTFQEIMEAYYIDDSMFYLKRKGKAAEQIRLNKHQILKRLSDKSADVEKFITDYALNLKKESDVVRLLDFYNSLSSPQPDAKQAQS